MSVIEDVMSTVEGALGKTGSLSELGPVKLVGGLRLAVGLAGVLTPGLCAFATGLKPSRNPSVTYLVRLNGAGNAALGAGILAGPAAAQPLLIQIGLARDVIGLLATKRARRKGAIGLRTALTYGLTELALVGLGGAVLSGEM